MEVVPGPGEVGCLVAVPGGPAEAVAGVAGEAAQLLEAAAGELVREGRRRQQPRHLVQPRQQQLLLLVEEGVGRPRPELGVIWRTGEVTHLPLYVWVLTWWVRVVQVEVLHEAPGGGELLATHRAPHLV